MTHVIVPDGAVSLSFMQPKAGPLRMGFAGPSIRAHRTALEPGALFFGVRLRPGAAGSVLRADISAFRDRIGPPPDIDSPVIRMLTSEAPARTDLSRIGELKDLLTAAIARHAAPVDAPVCGFAARIAAAGGDLRLEAAGAAFGVGPRQMRRRFKYQCGLTPKEFARLRRVRRSCIAIVREQALGVAAAGSGFADQAHMSREFSDVFGGSPLLIRDYLRQIAHRAIVEREDGRFLQDARPGP